MQGMMPPPPPPMPGPMPPHGGMPPMPPLPPRHARTWRERLLGGGSARPLTFMQERTIPNWLIGKSVAFFFVAMFACWAVFGHVPGFDLWLTAAISVALFFFAGETMSRTWAQAGEKRFVRNVYVVGMLIRLLWVSHCYFFFNPDYYGNTYGNPADVDWYMPFAKDLALWLSGDSQWSLSQIIDKNGSAIDDVGYPMWLAVGYVIWGDFSDVFLPMVVKAIISAYCAVSIYHVAQRHYGDGAARIAAIFVCLNPNMIYWCGNMMKEAEMVLLCCLAIDNFDRVLSSGKKYTFKSLLPGILAGLALFFFRTALGLVFFLAVFAHIVMSSHRVMSLGKKILAGVLVGAVLIVAVGDRLLTQSQDLIEKAQSDTQEKNMEWRAKQKEMSGRQQSFATYASAAVFAPLIFTLPFPTFNQANEAQLLHIQLSGGSYIKNILSFFVIWVLFIMLVSGEWRRHVFILAYTLGYLLVLVMSPFAQSGRFHMPIWPMLMLFAAYGVQIAKTNPRIRKWYPLALGIEVVACLAWNWFKLKGRGMI